MNGLILVGGRSKRMGSDKSLLVYHKKPQWAYLYTLVASFCDNTFLSCRADQQKLFKSHNFLIDTYQIGPLGGILSAFEHHNNTAWLVVACDMPFVNAETIDFLVQNRNAAQIATSFQNPATKLPEPLLTLWEPAAYPLLNEAHQNGQRSPLKILQNAKLHLLDCPQGDWLRNINTSEEFTEIIKGPLKD